jgi:hypothetical protein
LLESVGAPRDRPVVRPGGAPTCSLSLRARGLEPVHSRQTSTPWSVFQDGPPAPITPAPLPERGHHGPGGFGAPRVITPPERLRPRDLCPPAGAGAGPGAAECPGGEPRLIRRPAFWRAGASPPTVSRSFNPLSKVLCNFRSRYLFAIGLWQVFSFRRHLPPA